MAAHAFIGTWEFVQISFIKNKTDSSTDRSEHSDCYGLKGSKFRLDETGDVTWIVPDEYKSVPLFCCETYELYNRPHVGVFLRFGAYAGHVIQFKADRVAPKDNVTLVCAEWGTLHCVRVKEECVEDNTTPFSLLPALEDGYFSDITIIAANQKQFKIHSCIVQLQASDIPWHSQPPPFTGLVEEVLGTILHYLYTECLPNTLTENGAKQVIAVATPYTSLAKLVDMCQIYLKNMALKQQIIILVNDIHGWLNQIIDRFATRDNFPSEDNITANPAKLCFVVKQSLRDGAVAGAKLLLLCDLFNKRKNELSREERHEIIRYAMSRLPVFFGQLRRFLLALKNTFSAMSSSQRLEVAAYLVPELEVILETISDLINDIERALLQIIQVLSPGDSIKPKSSFAELLGRSLRSLLHIRDLTKLRSFYEHITCSLGLLLLKRDNFNELSDVQKVRTIHRNLDQLIEEMSPFLLRVEEVTAALDDKLEWKDFKFCFKVGTSKVSGILQKLVPHKDKLLKVMIKICELVQREPFTQSMQSLGLLAVNVGSCRSSDSQKITNSTSNGSLKQNQLCGNLNLVESLCVSPPTTTSVMSKLALEMLQNERDTDMAFEIVNGSSDSSCEDGLDVAGSPVYENCTIKAHRVIVAARCDWFRRALLSGMREAIDRKVVIHDTNAFLFRIFLEYLYSGCLKRENLNTDQLAELLLLSDRYEVDSLKQDCEHALKSYIDQDTVLYLLSMADQFNAEVLKSACLSYISLHQELTENDVFFELPMTLQAEVFDCVWAVPPSTKSSTLDHLPTCISDPNHDSDLQENFSNMRLRSTGLSRGSSASTENIPVAHDAARMDSCLAQLRDILGDTPPREKLVQVILAADYNPCRAINFFYARIEEDRKNRSAS